MQTSKYCAVHAGLNSAWRVVLATVKTKDREFVLRDVQVGESPSNLLQQVYATLAQICQPFVAWRLEWSLEIIHELKELH